MKKLFVLLVVSVCIVSLAGCSSVADTSSDVSVSSQNTEQQQLELEKQKLELEKQKLELEKQKLEAEKNKNQSKVPTQSKVSSQNKVSSQTKTSSQNADAALKLLKRENDIEKKKKEIEDDKADFNKTMQGLLDEKQNIEAQISKQKSDIWYQERLIETNKSEIERINNRVGDKPSWISMYYDNIAESEAKISEINNYIDNTLTPELEKNNTLIEMLIDKFNERQAQFEAELEKLYNDPIE